ncbi:MAG TPA: two-component regulator propeller domain-containing protein, partial [Candidatus Saccharimonadales bacterium]|nr:two-component regulator propeller domain-containing protein [Candidatus Saccharimonadales bacterium]
GAALPDRIIVERLGRARGFPSQTLTAILRDHMGFLWVGSREGLALYDGYDVRVFEHDVSDPGSLADNAVRRLYEDTSGRLWVGLDSGGLQRLDRATGRFVTFSHDPKNPRSISHDQVFSMAEDGLGSLWVGTLEGLNRMDLATGAFERFAADPKNPGALPNPWIQDLFRDRKGRIWIATVGGGVARIDPATRRITRIPFGPDSGATDRSTLAFTIAEASDGTVHVGVEDGVFRFDETTSTLERLPIPQLHPGPRTAIVTSIAFAPDGTLWITTWDGGLVAWDPMASISRSYRHDPARETSIATDRLDQLTIDHTGEVWIASWGGGIQRFSSDSGLFATILEKRGDGGGLPEGEVTSVLEGSDGTLWIGTWGKGLCRRGAGDVVTDVAALHFPGEESEAEAETVLALAEEPGGDLWMGTMSALFRIGIGGRLEHVYRHSGNDPEGLGRGYVNALWLDRSDRLWVGTGGGGLHRLDPGKETFVHFLHDPANPGSLSDDFITSIREDSRGTIWVGTRAGGLNALDPATGEVHRFVPDPQDPHSLGHHTVTSILEDHRGIVWAGTAGGGLARIDRTGAASWSVSRVGVEDGLVSGNVVSIQEDDDGSLWIGTRRGLSRYDPEKRRFHNYVTGDGLPSLEFRPNASARGRTHLHFGTLGGVLSITRGTPFQEPAPTPTIISSVGTLEGTWKGARTPWETRELHVDYGIALSFQLDVMDLRPPHRYAYRLEGESDRWVDLGSRREITIAGLSPGAYELSVKGL